MSKLLKNTTGSAIVIADVGVTIPANSTFTTQASNSLLWAGSDELVVHLGSGDLVGNDGTTDLTKEEAIKLFQGLYPSTVAIQGAVFGINGMAVEANVLIDDLEVKSTVNSELTNPNISLNKQSLAYTSLYNYTGSGKLYSFKVKFNSANVESKLEIDGNVIFEIDCAVLGDLFATSSNSSSSTDFLQWDSRANVLTYESTYPISFTSSIKLFARANSNSNNKTMEICLINIDKGV